jgi:CBS domain-containing protein
MRALGAHDCDDRRPQPSDHSLHVRRLEAAMLRLRDIMTKAVITVTPDLPLGDVANLLARHRVSGIPVVSGNQLVGVVTNADLLVFLEGEASHPDAADAVDDRSPMDGEMEGGAVYFTDLWPDDESEVSERFERPTGASRELFGDHVVADAMTRTRYVLGPDAPVRAAADLMRRTREHRVLVVKDQALLGIVTSSDIVRAVGDGRLTSARQALVTK